MLLPMTRPKRLAFPVAASVLLASVLLGQEPAAVPPPTGTPTPESSALPTMNVYLPEGEFDIRLKRLIKNVLFEGQVNYEFADGDVSTFLRYKYYARNFTYKLGVFDTLEFSGLDDDEQLDFDRVRGGLLIFELPIDYNSRWYGTGQVDALSFGDTTRPDNAKTNVYLKLGYQMGTPFDERLNSIVGETRGRIPQVLTAYREIGPQKMGAAVALTHSFASLGDFNYIKFETEALKRSDFGNVSFLISRLHIGSFLTKEDVPNPDRPIFEQFSIPRYELFRLGGRDSIKGVDDQIARGTDELHLTNEFFYPVFRNRDYRLLGATFSNLFAIGYLGAGISGFETDVLTQLDDYVVDAGLGFETSAFVRDTEVFISFVYAQPFVAPDTLDGQHEYRFSVRTVR